MGAVKSHFSDKEYLLYYIERKDYDNIQKILDKKPELLETPLTGKTKMTPLSRACFNGNLPMAKYFVEQCGAKVNSLGPAGDTPLIIAARRNHLELVRYLLERGADVNVVTPVGISTLEYALLPGFYEIALLIYERLKDKELRSAQEYQQLGSTYHYRYVNYDLLTDSLKKHYEPENVPDFFKKEKKVFKDPVIDPRESWKDWARRQLEFKDPPLVEREELPEELQPQNRKFGKVKHFFSNLAMSPMVPQKPKFEPISKSEVAASSNELNKSSPNPPENIEMRSVQ